MPWTDNITNDSLRTLVTQAMSDSVYTYKEMLDLLTSAVSGGVTQTEYDDLKSIYTNSANNFETDYSKNITYKVIYDDPANASWWGGVSDPAKVTPLGNMTAGMSQENASHLVDKWFLGLDKPMPIAGGDTATGKAATGVYTYATSTGPLFENGATQTDVNQGSSGTCYLVASLGAIASAKSSFITGNIIDNKNGTYGVKFYLNGAATYVTVNSELPANQYGNVAFTSNAQHSFTGESWVSLYEKGYAQLNQQANIKNQKNWKGENSYQSVEGGFAYPIKEITNLNYTYYSSYYTSIPDPYSLKQYSSKDATTYKSVIVDALNNGAIGWLASFGNTVDGENGLKNLVSGHAFMLLGYDSQTDKFTIRNPWGGTGGGDFNAEFKLTIDQFWNDSIKAVIAVSEPPQADPVFDYALSSNADGTAKAVNEGDAITFTVTRTGTVSAPSTVYVSTQEGTAVATDYKAIDKTLAVNFAAFESTKTVAVATCSDTLKEETESFTLNLYLSGQTVAKSSASGFIKDVPVTDYTYTLESSTATTDNAVTEGSAVTFTIKRSGSGSASTVYLSTRDDTATSGDYQGFVNKSIEFAAYETSKTVTVATLQDNFAESTEKFTLNLSKNLSDTTATASSAGYIKDPVLPYYSYSVVSSAGSPETAVVEGGKVSFTIRRSGSGSQSTIYASVVEKTAGADDYTGFTQKEITFSANETTATVEVATVQDWWLEATEYFSLNLYQYKSDTSYTSYGAGFIKDNPLSTYNYTVTSNASSTAIVEGNSVVFTITRNAGNTASTVYLSTLAGTATSEDYQALDKFAVNFSAFETTKTVSVAINTDSLTEGQENFSLTLFRSLSDSGYSAFSKALIDDPPETEKSVFAVKSSTDATHLAAEGSAISFTVTRSTPGSAATIYLGTKDSSSGGNKDYQSLQSKEVKFAANETTKTITVNTYKDNKTEGNQSFWLNLFSNYADAQNDKFATYATGHIQDANVTNYNYTITSSSDLEHPASEGNDIIFTITRDGSGEAASVFLNTADISAVADNDYLAIVDQEITFAANETSKTITVETFQLGQGQGTRSFWLDLYTTHADLENDNYASYASGYIKDASVIDYGYTMTSSADAAHPALEGEDVTFTITRSGSGSVSHVYLATSDETASSGSDYLEITTQEITFAANETIKTFTVNTCVDVQSEGSESFWLSLFASHEDFLDDKASAYASGYVKNGQTTSYTYAITSSADADHPTTEGEGISFTITRSGTGSASTVYLSTADETAIEGSNYQGIAGQKLQFAANETSKTVTIATFADTSSEGVTSFWLDLFTSHADLLDENYAAYSNGHIKAVPDTNSTYTIASSTDADHPATEGTAITFTITRNGSESVSTVFLNTADNNAWSGSDYQAVTAQALTFGAGESSKTITVTTYQNHATEGVETFHLDLFTHFADIAEDNYAAYGDGHITDAQVVGYTYSVSTTSDADHPVIEGDAITFTITRSGSGSASTVYVSTIDNTAFQGSDYQIVQAREISFAANETSRTVTITTLQDAETEGEESFFLNLYTEYADLQTDNYATFATATITDQPSSAVAGNAFSASAVSAHASASATAQTGTTDTLFPGHASGQFNNSSAFFAQRSDGTLVVWGNANNGGNTSAVASRLTALSKIVSNVNAFAALRTDGSVVTWGDANSGGSSDAVASQLNGSKGAVNLYSTALAFAALRSDGSVITWGNKDTGGDSSGVASQLNGSKAVTSIYSNMSAFAAIRSDGSVTTWGYDAFGGSMTAVASALDGTIATKSVASTGSAFAALRADGSVITWGNPTDGGNSSAVAAKLNGATGVVGLFSTTSAFSALLNDGSVVVWGDVNNGAQYSSVATALNGTIKTVSIAATDTSFAALREDGSVITWGNDRYGGDSSAIKSMLDGSIKVARIYANHSAFAALRADGSVVTWGYATDGGDAGALKTQLNGTVAVTDIVATDRAFAALRSNGSVVAWGNLLDGGDTTAVQSKLDGAVSVVKLNATSGAFAALRSDGTVVTWGNADSGGNSSGVADKLQSVAKLAEVSAQLTKTLAMDIDRNGVVDATDGVLILRRLSGAPTIDTGISLNVGNDLLVGRVDGLSKTLLDVDQSGAVDGTDGVLLLRLLSGAPTLDTGIILPQGQSNATVIATINQKIATVVSTSSLVGDTPQQTESVNFGALPAEALLSASVESYGASQGGNADALRLVSTPTQDLLTEGLNKVHTATGGLNGHLIAG
ncbi:MAG: hypothetical protein HQL95_10270 [Magnetococcales bacterium]|nr:hypothetical protein [Magnetococcales bacterium]